MNLSVRFNHDHSVRGESIIARKDVDGGVTAILPGGTWPGGHQAENPVLQWRVARWAKPKGFRLGGYPDLTTPLTLAEAMQHSPDHAEWMLKRTTRQLAIISRYVTIGDPEDRLLATNRARMLQADLAEGIGFYTSFSQQAVPAEVDEQIVATHTLIGDRFIH